MKSLTLRELSMINGGNGAGDLYNSTLGGAATGAGVCSAFGPLAATGCGIAGGGISYWYNTHK